MNIIPFVIPTKEKIILFAIFVFLFLPIVFSNGCGIRNSLCTLENTHINYFPPVILTIGFIYEYIINPIDISSMNELIEGAILPINYYLLPAFLTIIYYLISCTVVYFYNKKKLNN
ncbi:MAG: hypothetical protein KAI55_02685 [Candidatus Aenigmarchaeota archaeon]|nr:hypothetical protein [Candidatus Aenigmarchaeota archaeon]